MVAPKISNAAINWYSQNIVFLARPFRLSCTVVMEWNFIIIYSLLFIIIMKATQH